MKSTDKDSQASKKRRPAPGQHKVEASPSEKLVEQSQTPLNLPDHPNASSLRQAQVLQLQRKFGNAFVQRFLGEKGRSPVELEIRKGPAAIPPMKSYSAGNLTTSVQRSNDVEKGPSGTKITVRKDPKESRRLIFNQPVSQNEAVTYLWGNRYVPEKDDLVPDPAESPSFLPLAKTQSRQTQYLINNSNLEAMIKLRREVISQYKVPVPRSDSPAKPRKTQDEFEQQIPRWVPATARKEIAALVYQRNYKLPLIRRYPAEGPWGDIVFWSGQVGRDRVHYWYRYRPEGKDYYRELYGSGGFWDLYADLSKKARLKRNWAKTWNKDMEYWVEKLGLYPPTAKRTLEQQWIDLSRQWLGAVAMAYSSAPGIPKPLSVSGRTGRPGAPKMRGPRRGGAAPKNPATTARELVDQRVAKGKKVEVNIGGTGAPHEPASAINVNPNVVAPRKGIPNHVKANAEEIGQLFPSGSVDEVVAHGLPHDTLNWSKVIPGTSRVMKPGGKVDIKLRWPHPGEAAKIAKALRDNGFKDVKVFMDVIVTAVK